MNVDSSKEPPTSYWQATASPPALAAHRPPHTNIVIIGGGIMGAAACYWLARIGQAPLLLERKALASGATGRNGGFVTIGPASGYAEAVARFGPQPAQTVLRVTQENQELLAHLLLEEQIEADYRQAGSLHLALNEEEWHHLEQEATLLHPQQVQVALLDRAQVQRLLPTPLADEIIGGSFFPQAGLIHPVKFVAGLIAAAQRSGAHIAQATVTRLEPTSTGIRLHTSAGSLSASQVLVATNAWIREVLPALAPLMTPVRGQMLASAPLPPLFSAGMSASLTPTGEYWQQRPDGTIVPGGCRAAAPDWEVNVTQSDPTPPVQRALEAVLPRLFPHLPPLQVQQRWAGLMAFTPDLLPIADQMPELPGVWFAGGFCGHGMPFGLRFGQLLAEAMTTATAPVELAPFRLDRPTLPALSSAAVSQGPDLQVNAHLLHAVRRMLAWCCVPRVPSPYSRESLSIQYEIVRRFRVKFRHAILD
jgi:gamma-glutamylputrescine oxidase